MKKLILGFILVLSTLFNCSTLCAQNHQETELEADKCVKKYDIIVDGYYGFPYLLGYIYRQYLEDTLPGALVDPRITNHLGGKIEYMVWKQISFGLEYSYAALSFKYQGTNANYYFGGYKKQRFLAKFNFHFATSKNLDPYLTAGIGYSQTKTFSDEPKFETEFVNLIPVASRLGIGIRYFFTDMLGLNVEVGLGGPLIQTGVSLKF